MNSHNLGTVLLSSSRYFFLSCRFGQTFSITYLADETLSVFIIKFQLKKHGVNT